MGLFCLFWSLLWFDERSLDGPKVHNPSGTIEEALESRNFLKQQ